MNVAAGKDTPDVVRQLRAAYPHLPVIASSEKTGKSMLSTIEAGADAVTWVPPSVQELQRVLMDTNRMI